MYSVCAFSFVSFLLFAKNIVILEWTNWLRVFVCLVLIRPCLVPRRAFCGLSHLHDEGERVGKEARHNKGVYLTLCLRRNESSKFTIIKVLNLATVDAPGVIFSFLCGYMLAIIVSLRMQCVSAYMYLTGRIIISAWALTLSVRL